MPDKTIAEVIADAKTAAGLDPHQKYPVYKYAEHIPDERAPEFWQIILDVVEKAEFQERNGWERQTDATKLAIRWEALRQVLDPHTVSEQRWCGTCKRFVVSQAAHTIDILKGEDIKP